MKDTLDHLDLVPGGAQFVREIRELVERGKALDRALEPLHRKLRNPDMPLFAPVERTTSKERSDHFLFSSLLAGVSKHLQHIATRRAVHHVARKYAAHMGQLFLNHALHYHAGFQTVFGTQPEFRKLSTGELAAAWVSCGRVLWEHNQFGAIVCGNRPAPVPEHLRTYEAFAKYTEERVRNPDFKPPTADPVELDARGLPRA